MLYIDPTAMLEKQKQEKREAKQTKIGRVFIFSALGALVGAALCVLIDWFLGDSINGIFYLISGMSACAFYLYFIQRKDQKKIHLLIIAAAILLVTVLSIFVEFMILHSAEVRYADMNVFEKTIELYKQNISNNGLTSQAHQMTNGEVLYYDMSIMAFHIMSTIMAEIGFFASYGILSVVTKSWEKKHGKENVEYGYVTRKSRSSKNRNKRNKRR